MTSEQLPFYIGRYLVTGRLGAGGMGVVYLATDERLHRQVAIKQLSKNSGSQSAHLRIRQEALLLAQLNHSHIVQIYDVVEERGEIALVMEYVDGCSLSTWQRERAPGLTQKIQLLKQICSGLSRAHGAGIIHRDLKADNILIDGDNTAKITDFGIAKNWRESNDLTLEHHIAGSWGAMSPEQALGKPLDNRSDIFSFGVLAYQLLCGQNPFGDSESPYIVTDRIVHKPHPPAQQLNPALPVELCRLLDRMLAKDPERRPLNAAEVCAELEAAARSLDPAAGAETTSVTVTAEHFFQRRERAGRGRRATIAAGLLAVAAITTALAYFQRAPEGKYIAVVSPPETPGESREVGLLRTNILSAVQQGLASREGLYLVPHSESQQLRGQPLREQAQKLNVQLLLSPSLNCGPLQCEVSMELIDTGSFSVLASRSTQLELSRSLESRSRTLQQLDFLLPEYPDKGADLRPNIGEDHYRTYLELFARRYENRDLEQLLDALESLQARAPYFPPLYELYGSIILRYRYISRSERALERLEEFLRKVPQQLSEVPELLVAKLLLAGHRDDREQVQALLARLKLTTPDQSSYYHAESIYHLLVDDHEAALGSIDRALARRVSGEHLVQKATILTMLGRLDQARPYLEQALRINHKNREALSLLAANELDAGRSRETIRLLAHIEEDQLGALDTLSLCYAYFIERQFEPARDCFTKAADLAPSDPDPLLYLSEIARQLEREEQAQQLAGQALARSRSRGDWEGLLTGARALAELGQTSKAVENLLKARRQAPDDIYVNYNSAQVYMATNDFSSARAHIRRSLALGMSPIWLNTWRFARICSEPAFADLRRDYPALCEEAQQPQIAGNKNQE